MKKYLLTLLLLGSLNAFSQTAKVKIVLYPNTDEEFNKAMKMVTDTAFSKEFCFEVIRKHKSPDFPSTHSVVMVDFYSCDGNVLLGICHADRIPSKKELLLFGHNSLTLATNPNLKKSTKVLY